MFSFLNKPYDLLEYRRFQKLLLYGVPVFIFIFLMFFQPFGLSNLNFTERFRALLIFFIILFIVLYFNYKFLRKFILKKYTLGNTILWFVWSLFLISCTIFVVNTYLFNDGRFYFTNFFWFIIIAFSTSVIPITIIILLHYNFILARRLDNAENINGILKSKKHEEESFIFEDENNKKRLTVSSDSFLYITSADNYIEIYYLEDNKISHTLIRNSLNNIEKSFIDRQQLLRCHKSYIINLNNVISVTGNTAGYKLRLKNTNALIPVSRKLNKRILEIFNY